MPELHDLLERRASRYEPPPDLFDRVLDRRRRRDRNRRIGAAVVALAMAAAGIGVLVRTFTSGLIPASDPRSLGVFKPVAGRIVYMNEGIDRGYDPGLWAVDPSGPSDTTEGPSVADDVASTLVRLDPENAIPLGWSSDGTELLLMREDLDTPFPYEDELFILHADGSETKLNMDSTYIEGATIAPDGSRVVFAAGGGPYFPYNDLDLDPGLFVVDTDGGRPVPIPYPPAGDPVSSPTFSPDGTRIAYLVTGFEDDVVDVWVANADGSNAREILADEPEVAEGVSSLVWSPAGDRIAMDNSLGRVLEIYTFAPDGSDFTTVITGGMNPVWSPDGSQIAYMVPHDPPPGVGPSGLAIADADGSNVRAFGFAASGPWHPGSVEEAPTPPENPTPTPSVWSPVLERDASAVHREPWLDPQDAPEGWVDIRRVRFSVLRNPKGPEGVGWTIELAAKPPVATGLEPGRLIAYGLVLDTTGDGVADYLIGIDNDAPEPGDFHVWVTDLATGETDEQVGPPYGYPIEFAHPDERGSGPNMVFTFLPGSAPADLNPETVRFYAWASAASDGEVFATDYAPDTGWATRP